jgi:aminoglycoside phosphotransferase (APT) family kinase protein
VPLEEIEKIARLPAYLPTPSDLEELWARVGAYIRDHDSPLLPAIQAAFTASIDTATRAEQSPALIHGDLWYENMIFDGNRIVGIIDFEAVSAGPAIVDFMTQGYVGDDFRRAVVSTFQKYAKFDYDEALGKSLMFLRELQGLDYGIRTQDVDDDALAKIAAAASEV